MGKKVNQFIWSTASAVLLVLATSPTVMGRCELSHCGDLPSSGDGCMAGTEEIFREPCKTSWGTQGHTAYCCPKNSTESLLSSMYGAEINEFPHMAMLTKGGGFACGATIYNSRYILTAAHCVVDAESGYVDRPDRIGIKVGRNVAKIQSSTNDYHVEQVIVHENYKGLRKFARFGIMQSGSYNDIALLRLDRNIEFGEQVKSLQVAPKGLDELSREH
ncbi:unnamed protein product [Orchesella dallaii]|uniref:Peptidase S1 domain-containing protein n=1 Tax=Orchesella dallaii TaxID=48710 RepID=A0ABP1S1J9_9HEXA